MSLTDLPSPNYDNILTEPPILTAIPFPQCNFISAVIYIGILFADGAGGGGDLPAWRTLWNWLSFNRNIES